MSEKRAASAARFPEATADSPTATHTARPRLQAQCSQTCPALPPPSAPPGCTQAQWLWKSQKVVCSLHRPQRDPVLERGREETPQVTPLLASLWEQCYRQRGRALQREDTRPPNCGISSQPPPPPSTMLALLQCVSYVTGLWRESTRWSSVTGQEEALLTTKLLCGGEEETRRKPRVNARLGVVLQGTPHASWASGSARGSHPFRTSFLVSAHAPPPIVP